MDPIALGETGFNLDISFTDLDVNSFSEFLVAGIDSFGNNYNLGEFPLTVISTSLDGLENTGFGNLFVDFSSIGGAFFSDPFQVTLTPSSEVNIGFGNGSASLTLSYESKDVPEPITGLVLAAGLGGAALKRTRDKSKKK